MSEARVCSAVELLSSLPDESVDAILTDPPYGTASGATTDKVRHVTAGGARLEGFELDWDRSLPVDWIAPAARVLKPGAAIVTFTDASSSSAIWGEYLAAGIRPLQFVYWRKTTHGMQPRKNFCSAVEVAVFGRKPGKILCWRGGGSTPNCVDAAPAGPYERAGVGHPTQKPLAVARWLARLVVPAGGLVVDPFAGAHTFGVAAILEGASYLGGDLDPQWAVVGAERIARASAARSASPSPFAARATRARVYSMRDRKPGPPDDTRAPIVPDAQPRRHDPTARICARCRWLNLDATATVCAHCKAPLHAIR